MTASYFPPEISQLVQEYEEGTFRLKGNKMTIIIRQRARGDTKERCLEVGTFDAQPGLWKAVLSPFTYQAGITWIPLILAPNNFDISTLSPITQNQFPTLFYRPFDDINILYRDEVVASFKQGEGKEDLRNMIKLNDVYSASGAYIFLSYRQGALESAAYAAIKEYVRGQAAATIISEIERKIPGAKVKRSKMTRLNIGVLTITLTSRQVSLFPHSKNNTISLWAGYHRPEAGVFSEDNYEELRHSPIYEEGKQWILTQTEGYLLPLDHMIALYRKIMSDYEGRGFENMGNVRFVVDSDNTYHIEEALDNM